MPLFLLDRDGVLLVNRPTNVKTPDDLELLPGAVEALARLTRAGYDMAICTNQPEVGSGAMTQAQLKRVHAALRQMLAHRGARIDAIFCCTSVNRCPAKKPAPGMLLEALDKFGARPSDTAFIGDQVDDLKAAFHAGCRRVLVLTGLGRHALEEGLPQYVDPVEIATDLPAAVEAELARASFSGDIGPQSARHGRLRPVEKQN